MMRRPAVPLSLAAALFGTAPALHAQGAEPLFESGLVTHGPQDQLHALLDLDDDGIQDAVGWWWTNYWEYQATVRGYRGNGIGALEEIWSFDTPFFGSSVEGETDNAVGDFDGDGVDDFALGFGNRLVVYFSRGTQVPILGHDQTLPWVQSVRSLRAADFDGDGLDDIVVGRNGGLAVYLNRGATQPFEQVSEEVLGPWGRVDLAIGEVTGDGQLDIVARHQDESNTNRLWVFPAVDGVTGVPTSFDVHVTQHSFVTLGDIDGDGDDDVALFQPQGVMQVFRQTSAGVLTREPLDPGGPATHLLDIDGDGDLDGACCGSSGAPNNSSPSTFRVCLNDGTGNFDQSAEFPGLGAARLAGMLDFDGDGDRDLVAGRAVLHNLANIGASVCSSSVNSTGNAAVMVPEGSASVSRGDLMLAAHNVPAGQPGLFYFSHRSASVPFGNGTRCIGLPMHRLPVSFADESGRLELAIDYTGLPPSAPGLIEPGATRFFQAWFRDPSVGEGFDFSDAVRIQFAE